jgi:hypothetical protein
MANTIGTGTYSSVWRAKYAKDMLQLSLRSSLIAEAICRVDRSDSFYIHSPYLSGTLAANVNTSGLTGTYAVTAQTTVEDSLTVSEEFTYATHVYDFERRLATVDLFQSFVEELNRAIADSLNLWVVNELCESGTGTYSTPTGGFTTAANWPVILSNLLSKVAGYRDSLGGYFLVLENTDLVGVIQAQMATGFNFADAANRNGLVTNQAGVDIYVVRSGTFKDDSAGASGYSGTKTWTNSGHRVFGIKNLVTYANPGGIQYREIDVTLKTGKEVLVWGYAGLKVWNKIAATIIDITLA